MYIFAHALCVFVYMWRWRCSRWNDATQRDLPNKQTTWNVFCFFACWCCKNTRALDRLWQHRRLHNRKKAPLFGGGAVLARADKRITQSKHKFDDGQSRAVCVCVCLCMRPLKDFVLQKRHRSSSNNTFFHILRDTKRCTKRKVNLVDRLVGGSASDGSFLLVLFYVSPLCVCVFVCV